MLLNYKVNEPDTNFHDFIRGQSGTNLNSQTAMDPLRTPFSDLRSPEEQSLKTDI